MTWDLTALDAAIDETLRAGSAQRICTDPSERPAVLRAALYNRAKARGLHQSIRFELKGETVKLRQKPKAKGLLQPTQETGI